MTSTAVLVGRPNAGKSSLFNLVTGGNAKVGNFPGITVDVLEGTVALDGHEPVTVVDLPGVYSVETEPDPHSDEGHARRYLDGQRAAGKAQVVVQVIDATHLEISLRLTNELKRRGEPLAVIVTQHDVLKEQGFELDGRALADRLGAEVLVLSVREPQAAVKAKTFLHDVVRKRNVPSESSVSAAVVASEVVVPLAGAAAAAAKARGRTARLDRVLLHPVLAPLCFLGLMSLVFGAVFLVAEPVTALLDAVTQALGARIETLFGPGWVTSLLVDGVLGGAGTVLAFLPQIVILTMALEVIEASGYLARGTFVVHRILRAAGLGGRSFVPLLTAHACAVPAIQATRIVRDPSERLRTILVLPLMTCSARIPTYGLFVVAFFSERSALFKGALFVGLYVAGMVSGFIASWVLNRGMQRSAKPLPLALEMPSYRRPQVRVVLRTGWRAALRFARDVGTVIVVASVVLWGLLTIPGPGAEEAKRHAPPGASDRVVAMHGSVAAYVGRALEPVTRPAGFDWRLNVGLIGSLGARELMVGTMGVIFGLEGDDTSPLADDLRKAQSPDGRPAYGVPTALALMAFFVIACQCTSTLAAIRRETRSWKWAGFVLGYTYVAAWLVAVAVFQGSTWLGL